MTAREKGPFVLLAHSYGGFIARLFTRDFPTEVSGLVLVDSTEEGEYFAPASLQHYASLMLQIDELRTKALQAKDFGKAAYYAAIADEGASIKSTPLQMRAIGGFGTLGDRPIIVIAHAKPFTGGDAVIEPHWRAGQERLVTLSSNAKFIIAENSDHNIEISEPELILSSVKDVVGKLRDAQR